MYIYLIMYYIYIYIIYIHISYHIYIYISYIYIYLYIYVLYKVAVCGCTMVCLHPWAWCYEYMHMSAHTCKLVPQFQSWTWRGLDLVRSGKHRNPAEQKDTKGSLVRMPIPGAQVCGIVWKPAPRATGLTKNNPVNKVILTKTFWT